MIKKLLLFILIINIYPFKISYISTIGECGIAVCTKHLVDELNKIGHQANIIDSLKANKQILEDLSKNIPDIINIQFSAGSLRQDIFEITNWAKERNIKIVVTVHENFFWLKEIEKEADSIILYSKQIFKKNNKKHVYIPMAVPNFIAKESREIFRSKYGFKKDDIIISTFGFMIDWKAHDQIIYCLAPYMKKNKKIKLQFLTSFCNRIDLSVFYERIQNAIKNSGVSDRIIHITDFLPEQEVNERLYLSDIGFLWGEKDYGVKILGDKPNTTSASDKQFVAARLPLVVVDCPHYHNCNIGCIKVKDKKSFIQNIIFLTQKPNFLNKLRANVELKYQKNCVSTVINEHIKTFNSLLK